ncbi:MAG: hypothetical protein ABIJ21_03930 [Nanoarchaeota archaeon]
MGTITISLDDETEAIFRKKTYQLYGRQKGVLAKALTEALTEWSQKKEYIDSCMALLEKGIDMGKITYEKRDELHERH